MISFLNIASGSKGNATLIYDEKSLLLLDMGISLSSLKEGLKTIGKGMNDIAGVLLTHNHSDHVKGLPYLHGRYPVYAGEGAVSDKHIPLAPYESFKVATFDIVAIPTSHDAPSSMGYLIASNGSKLVYITDTGMLYEESYPYLENADYYIFESNHDLGMLMRSSRPKILKDRIKGDKGHLSNADSALYLARLIGERSKAIYLAHLSGECNSEELALKTYRDIFFKKSVSFPCSQIIPLRQWAATKGGDQ